MHLSEIKIVGGNENEIFRFHFIFISTFNKWLSHRMEEEEEVINYLLEGCLLRKHPEGVLSH